MLQTPSLVCLTFRFTMANADVVNLEATIIEATHSSLCRDTAALKHPTNSVADLLKMRHEQLRTGGRRLGQMAGQTCSFKAEDESESPERLN